MNNKFTTLLEDSRILEKQLGHFSGVALVINREIQQRFTDSERTGQCAAVISLGLTSVSAFYVPDNETDMKLRYLRNAHNKEIFLLENEHRISTAPQSLVEKQDFEKNSIYRGGIRLEDGKIITISGYHPVVDEAYSLNLGLVTEGIPRDYSREKWIKDQAIKFQNPYALGFCVMANYINPQTGYTVGYRQSIEWGLKEIGENFL